MVFCHLRWRVRKANNMYIHEEYVYGQTTRPPLMKRWFWFFQSATNSLWSSPFSLQMNPTITWRHVCVKDSQILQCSKNIILVDTVKLKVQCKLQLEYTVRYSRNFHLYTGQQNLPRNYCSCLFFEACHLNFLSFATAWEVNFELFVQHFFLSAERVRKEIIIHKINKMDTLQSPAGGCFHTTCGNNGF